MSGGSGMRARTMAAGLVAPVVVALTLVPAAPVAALTTPPSPNQSYAYTGGPQIYVVPPGVTSISVLLRGAAGSSPAGGGTGGLGGEISGTISVTPGEVLQFMVGGSGASGGFNGGSGGGGGATDIRRPPFSTSSSCAYNLTCNTTQRIIVAGGGGGGGSVYVGGSGGGNGGAGGANPTAGTSGASSDDSAAGGGPGSLVGGGAGGQGQGVTPANGSGAGGNGAFGSGGPLGWKAGATAGGGGSGYYGGGGGGSWTNAVAAGGGGGSSWGGGTGVSVDDSTTGTRSGNGEIIVSPPSAITNAAFGLTGAPQYYRVAPDVTELAVRLYGGGSAAKGDVVYGRLPVTPDDTLQVTIGGAGVGAYTAPGGTLIPGSGGFNGGGTPTVTTEGTSGGGGASDIRVRGADDTLYGLEDRVVVAGGGGGCTTPFWCPSNSWIPGAGGSASTGSGGTGSWSAGGNKFQGGSLTAGGVWLDSNSSPISTPAVAAGSFGVGGSSDSGGGGGYYGGAGGAASGGGSSYASVTGPDPTKQGVGNVLGTTGAAFSHTGPVPGGGNAGDGMAVITAMPRGVTTSATLISNTSATIVGAVNPKYLASSPKVFYSEDETTVVNGAGSSASLTGPGGVTVLADDSLQAVSGTISGSLGRKYFYRVCAQSVAGNGCGSVMSFTTIPGAPSAVSGTPGGEQVSLNWTAPSPSYTVTGYRVQVSRDNGVNWDDTMPATQTSSATSVTVTGLADGSAYEFRVAAINAAGRGADSSASSPVTPRSSPGAPGQPTGTPGDQQVPLVWSAPDDTGGAVLTGYKVQISDDSGASWDDTMPATLTSTSTAVTVTGLTNGVGYIFRVAGINIAGPGTYSPVSAVVTPRTTPGAPGQPVGVVTGGQVSLTWSGPADNGGASISGYRVQSSDDSGTTWTDAAPSSLTSASTAVTLTSLAGGSAYLFRVRAINVAGEGPYSAPSALVEVPPPPNPGTPLPPGAPTRATAIPGNGLALVSWLPPANAGSFPVTSYQVTASPGGRSCLTNATSCIITGLVNGTSYTFTVSALNGAGWGAPATTGAVTPSSGPTPAPEPQPLPAPLAPGESSLTVNGSPQPVEIEANAQSTGLEIVGPGFSMSLDGLGADGQPLNLGPDGVLILEQDRQASSAGRGFMPRSTVGMYIYPEASTIASLAPRAAPILVGTLATDGQGEFAGLVTLPESLTPGDHTLQAVGLTTEGEPRALSIGVRVSGWIVLDQGTRQADGRHDRIRATGSTGGIDAGARLTPWIRYAGQGAFTQGKASITVQSDGTFQWTRQIKKSKGLTAYVSYVDTESNRVFWAKVR